VFFIDKDPKRRTGICDSLVTIHLPFPLKRKIWDRIILCVGEVLLISGNKETLDWIKP